MTKDLRIECCENGWVVRSGEQPQTGEVVPGNAIINNSEKNVVFTDPADVLAFVESFIGD